MQITWDEDKNESNFQIHGIWFEEILNVLFDPLTLFNQNKHTDRNRFEYLGLSEKLDLLYVITVEKDESTIRVISARKATLRERKGYEEKEN